MSNKQVQIRRDTASNLNATTPATGEMAYDTTNKRFRLGDGSTAGGVFVPNYKDNQENTFTYADASGTNTITATYTPAIAAHTKGLTLGFKAANTNTTACTFSPNGLTAKNIYKRSGGTIGALAAGDIIAGGMYKITYDGTQYQIESTEAGASVSSISQGNINTNTGSFSGLPTGSPSWLNIALPGGQYGFYPNIGKSGGSSFSNLTNVSLGYVPLSGTLANACILTVKGYTTGGSDANTSVPTMTGTQRYITASPPFDMGDGVAHGFCFLLLNKSGDLVAHYLADVPPWAYNGPTSIRADHICPRTGNKFRKAMKKRSLEELMNGAKVDYEYEEITHDHKNADMGLIPHPFIGAPEDHTVVMLDPMDDRMASLISHLNSGGVEEIQEALLSGKIYADNKPLKRKGPKDVMQAGLRFKYTGK